MLPGRSAVANRSPVGAGHYRPARIAGARTVGPAQRRMIGGRSPIVGWSARRSPPRTESRELGGIRRQETKPTGPRDKTKPTGHATKRSQPFGQGGFLLRISRPSRSCRAGLGLPPRQEAGRGLPYKTRSLEKETALTVRASSEPGAAVGVGVTMRRRPGRRRGTRTPDGGPGGPGPPRGGRRRGRSSRRGRRRAARGPAGAGDRDAAHPAMPDPRPLQVQPPEDQPEIAEGPQRPRVAEDDQVEQAVVLPGRRGDRQPEGVLAEVEDEGHRPGSSSGGGSSTRTVSVEKW